MWRIIRGLPAPLLRWENFSKLQFMTTAWAILLVAAAGIVVLLLLLHHTRFGSLIHEHISDRPRRRLFLASLSFFLTFAGVRGVVYGVEHHIPPFHYVTMSGRHIHHLVFGIIILLLVGYGWLIEIGTGTGSSSILASRLMSLLYGVGAALTLDEFALWLNLKDVYFSREGRSSFDAVILFGSLLALGAWGAPLFSAVFQGKAKTRR
jgi:hypothetical protein